MIILKSEVFRSNDDLTKFININTIKRENIFSITVRTPLAATVEYALFFYADSQIKEINRGFFGW